MPFIELICPKCKEITEELISAKGEYPECKKCGVKLSQKYSGKCYIGNVKTGGCGGNCGGCSGCGK